MTKCFIWSQDKGRSPPPADSDAAAEDERQPLLPTQIEQREPVNKAALASFLQPEGEKKEKKDCHMAASLFCGVIVLLCNVQTLISLGVGELFNRQTELSTPVH